jgi:ribonuclease P protein component
VYRFDKTKRLLNKSEYNQVFKQAEKIVTSDLIVLHRKNSIGNARIGFVLAKKNIPKACQRNRLKRLLRESFRQSYLPAVDIVVIGRYGLSNVSNEALTSKLGNTWKKLIALYASS